jgi:hypothetical protein
MQSPESIATRGEIVTAECPGVVKARAGQSDALPLRTELSMQLRLRVRGEIEQKLIAPRLAFGTEQTLVSSN